MLKMRLLAAVVTIPACREAEVLVHDPRLIRARSLHGCISRDGYSTTKTAVEDDIFAP